MQVAIIIPALNEAGNIGALVKEAQAIAPVKIVVVDNGSTDSTPEEAQEAGATVVTESRHGYGYACAAGVAESQNAGILVFMDGDGSFSPSDLPLLLAPILNNQADMVLGSRARGRMARGSMPPHQRFGNWLAARLMNMLYGISITDPGPFRAVRSELLNKLNMQEMTYGWPTEMIVKSARRKARITEAPVNYQNRRFGKSKVSGTVRGTILATWFILGVTFRYAWKSRG